MMRPHRCSYIKVLFCWCDVSRKHLGKNELRGQTFDLRWSWISLAHERYIVNETDSHLVVVLHRRGYLGETAFVGISARNLSARQGLDFSASYARQVQFSPGQTEAEWRLRLLDDASFERHEEFLVVLGQALKAATEYSRTRPWFPCTMQRMVRTD
ncbi:hypothetical protein HPB51_012957 [Rhipicephalus microplus]|uniref:Calx-beta domain-containing protein n=1 Tax=Rhipicephalus microplus TaxID=6941 RepID=A0A9J6F2C7_RHIMP|nr:hypothetical protein HPB51_012957 [Rhipicephalus microplus]